MRLTRWFMAWAAVSFAFLLLGAAQPRAGASWTGEELAQIQSLSIAALKPLPPTRPTASPRTIARRDSASGSSSTSG